MNKEEIKYSYSNINTINDENNEDNNNLFGLKLIILFEFEMKELSLNMTLIDLKKYINLKFHLQDYEYILFIGKNNINNLPQDTLVSDIVNKFNVNKITIKTFKNIFDVHKELDKYEYFLANNISLKNDDINMLINEYKNIKEEINNN